MFVALIDFYSIHNIHFWKIPNDEMVIATWSLDNQLFGN